MNTQTLPRHSVKKVVENARPRLACHVASDKFAAKIRLASIVTSKEEEFNVWHANADKMVACFAWGGIAKRIG
jgi:transposase